MAKVSLRNYNREIETMIDRGQLDEAIAHCQHILKTFPKHLESYRLLGKAYLEYKRQDDAADIFLRVLAAEPNDFVANVGMSIIRDEQNKLDDAVWHMERAFEVQPSNPAIQAELQRLYGRRDGVTPPRIRMTRGALAHMYVQGELYPQAISEIKSVLKEDQGRSDMQALLARAYYKSGQKNDAAEAANSVLRRYPYCLDANRVLVEILGTDRPENAQVYRQRVFELDPYAAQVTGTVFQSDEVSDNAVTLEPLDWNGQPVKMESDWGETRAIAPESGRGAQEPDWLKSGYAEATPPPVSVPPPAQPTVVPPISAASSTSDFPTSSEPAAELTPEADIPEFLRAAGWGKSTGAFDESKTSFEEELASTPVSDESIAQADLPDWVKDMMPQEAAQAPETSAAQTAEEEEELPDWIKNIGPGAVAATAASSFDGETDWLQPEESAPASDEGSDWMKDLGQPAQSTSADEQPDWLKGIEQPAETASALPADDSSDWLQGLDQPAAEATPSTTESQPDWMQESAQPAPASDDTLNWLKNLDQPEAASPAAESQPDWLNNIEQPAETSAALPSDDSLDWLKGLDQPEETAQPVTESQPDWMQSPAQPAAASDDTLSWLKDLDQAETASPTEQEPSASEAQPDWLNSFDATEPAQPTPADQQPDWMKSFGESAPQAQTEPANELDWLRDAGEPELPKAEETAAPISDDMDFFEALAETPTETAQPPASPVDTGNLGTSQQEIDDSLAWLENLAAKQGATEGLLTKPEERLEQEPEWVKQAKGLTAESTAPEPVQEEPSQPTPVSSAEDLGTSQQEIDDSLAWLENLAAKQGATEGLLTKPEERLQEEPDWVKKIKASTPKPAEPVHPSAEPVQPAEPAQPAPAASVEDLGKSQQEIDDSLAWLENLAAKQGATEGLLTKPEERLEDEPEWVKQAKSAPPSQEPIAQTPIESTPEPEQETAEQLAPAASVEDLGKSQQEIDDSLAWLENLAAKQGATEGLLTKPEERLEEEPEWVKQAKSAPVQQEPAQPEPVAEEEEFEDSGPDTETWIRSLDQPVAETEPEPVKDDAAMWLDSLDAAEESAPASEPVPSDEMPEWLRTLEVEETKPNAPASADATSMWLKDLDKVEETPAPVEQPSTENVPEWLKESEAAQAEVAESVVPAEEAGGELGWLDEIETESAASPILEDDNLPNWLQGVDEEARKPATGSLGDLPGWMRDETSEALVEPTKIEPTRPTDWQPEAEPHPEPEPPQPKPEPAPVEPVEAQPEPAPAPRKPKPPKRDPATVRGTGMSNASVDTILESARNELSRSNIPGALEAYEKLIKKGRFLDEVIFDLRDALDRFPVEVSILQSLGDAYMRANRLQDALDAYTKAEELLR